MANIGMKIENAMVKQGNDETDETNVINGINGINGINVINVIKQESMKRHAT
jgi:hypothetical protein